VTISVIISAYNAAATLPACLEAVRSQNRNHGNSVELIVVNDGSSDETAKLAQDYGARVIHQTHQGIGAARNLGVEHARGDLIAFTDADCAAAPDWVDQITRPFADPEVMGVKGVYATRQRSLVARFAQAEYEEKYDRMRGSERIDFVDTYSAAYRKTVFLRNPGFDPRFSRSGEDIEFSYRLAERGCKLVFAPAAMVYHRHPGTLGGYFRRKFFVGYWRVWMYKMHPRKILTDSHTPQTLKLEMGLALAILAGILLSFFYTPALLVAAGGAILFLLMSLPFALATWHRDRAVALLSPLFLFWRALALNAGFFTALVIHSTLGFDSRSAPKP
jgi:glycosyltransferase involved in cell wall biosynthesis